MAKNLSNLNKYKKKKNSYSHKRNKNKIDKPISEKEKIIKEEIKEEDFIEEKVLEHQDNEKEKDIEKSENILFYVNKYSKYIFPALVIILTLIVYSTAINNDFVNWDDDRYVTGNPNLELNWQNIKLYFSDFYFVMYIPLTMLSYMIDFQIGGLESPEIFHLHSVILHVINSLLVFFFIAKLFSKIDNKNSKLYGLITALLFALHPLHIASVSWIAERKDVLFTMYFLASLLVYLFYTNNKDLKLYFLSLFLFLLSLLSKSQAVVLPIVLIFIDYLTARVDFSKEGILTFFKNKNFFKQRTINEKIPFFALSLIFGILAVIAAGTSEPFAENISNPDKIAKTGDAYSFLETFIFINYSFAEYIYKLIVPQQLSAIHPYPTNPGDAIPLKFYLYPVAVIGIIAALIYSFIKKQKVIVFGILFFTINMVLVLNIKNFIISEHYTYIPSIAVNILIAHFYFKLIKNNPKIKQLLGFVLIIYILFLSVFTFQRNSVFENSITFWDDVLEKYDNITIAYYNRGNHYQLLGDKEVDDKEKAFEFYHKAIADYDSTTNLHKYNIGAFSNRGVTKAKIGDAKGAIADFKEVVKIDSTYGNVYSNIGNARVMLGQLDKAIKNYELAISLKPNFVEAYFNLAVTQKNRGKYDKAIESFNKTLELEPDYNQVFFHRGFSYFSINELDKALDDFNLQLKTQPDLYTCYYYRAKIYEQRKEPEKAKSDYQVLGSKYPQIITDLISNADNLEKRADYTQEKKYYNEAIEIFNDIIKINPNYSQAYSRVGLIYGKLQNINLAITNFNTAIELDSLNSQAYADRGYAYFLTDNYKKAEKDYKKALQIKSNDEATYFNLAILYDQQKKYDLALQYFNKSIEINPQYSFAYLNRGVTLLKTGQKEQACKDFNTALQLGYKNAQAYLDKYCK